MTEARKHLLTSIPLLLIGISGIAFVCVGIYKEHNRTRKIGEEIAQQQAIANEINQDNALLQKTIEYLDSEEGQKFTAQEIGYQDENQEVWQVRNIPDDETETSVEILADGRGEVDDLKVWQKWWRVFF